MTYKEGTLLIKRDLCFLDKRKKDSFIPNVALVLLTIIDCNCVIKISPCFLYKNLEKRQ